MSAEQSQDEAASASAVGPTKPRSDWYQTQSNVCIDVMVKGVKREDASVAFTDKTVSVRIQRLDGPGNALYLELAHPIDPAKSSYKLLSTKIEVRLRKRDGLQWKTLEATAAPQTTEEDVHHYPSSKHYTCVPDWDRLASDIAKEEKEEKVEGDAALNNLFQKIYADGSDEVRKAMNKSFSESGGTVLSTNWGEVASKPTERKPPDGMEWKDYEK